MGVAKDLLGVAKTGPIESFVPMMLFAVLFGLSMDYEVFLMSRIRAMAIAARDADALVVMHQQPMNPSAAEDDVTYSDVMGEVRAHLAVRKEVAVAAGVRRERIVVDPGIGFGKTVSHNVELLARAGELRSLGPVLVGPSRKRFLRILSEASSLEELDTATVGACCLAVFGGVDVMRVHAGGEVRRALTIADAARPRASPCHDPATGF